MTENKWIYCSDRLPKANVPVLVTCLDRAGDLCVATGYLDLSGGWMIYPFSLNGSTEVIAWWPLPEPAEPKEIGMSRIDVWIPADERLPEVFRQKEED